MIEKSKRIGYFKRSNGDVVRCYRRAGNKILIVSVEEEDSNDAPSGSVLCPMWVEEESFFERNEDLRPSARGSSPRGSSVKYRNICAHCSQGMRVDAEK